MLHGEADCKVKVGEQAWKSLRADIEDSIVCYGSDRLPTLDKTVDEIMECIEDRLLSSINLGGF